MADHLQRMASPISLSSSPGRSSSFSTRPHWPWSTYTHRNSTSSLHSSTTSMSASSVTMDSSSTRHLHSISGTPVSQTAATLWQPLTVQQSPQHPTHEETTRQWSFLGFEWVIRDIERLRTFVECNEAPSGVEEESVPSQDDFEVLKESPILGDNKFKLEISHTQDQDGRDTDPKLQTLSVYITSLILDSSHSDYETTASIMVAIKSQDDRMGERGARAGQWVWEHWQTDWSFRQGSEVWEYPLPRMSALLENAKIKATDSFILCVQVHSPIGPFIPQQPSSYYVPRELLDGLESLLDSRSTGDVQFVCVERCQNSSRESPNLTSQPSSSSGSGHAEKLVRKRIIYAHSEILTRRSEYFATMFSSSFAETGPAMEDGRRYFTVIVEEADFETMYWLLKFCYANWLRFKDEDDPRSAIDGIGAGWSARWLGSGPSEWAWKPLLEVSDESNTGDTRSQTSGDTAPVMEIAQSTPNPSLTTTGRSHSATSRTVQSPPKAAVAGPPPSRAPSGPSVSHHPSGNSPSVMNNSSNVRPTRTISVPTTKRNIGSSSPRNPSSPRLYRQPSTLDPHSHPTPEPSPASALAMYSISHRYSMPNLAALALEHMMATITPESSFALLLASVLWDELHTLVEDYVVEKWELVSASQEFEVCCQEVAAGEWGPDGGQTFMKLLRRLRSPGALVYARV